MLLTDKEYSLLAKYMNQANPNLHHLRGALFDKYNYNKKSLLGYYKQSIRKAKLVNKINEITKIAETVVESDKFKKESLCYIDNASKSTAKFIAKKAIEQALLEQLPKYLKETHETNASI